MFMERTRSVASGRRSRPLTFLSPVPKHTPQTRMPRPGSNPPMSSEEGTETKFSKRNTHKMSRVRTVALRAFNKFVGVLCSLAVESSPLSSPSTHIACTQDVALRLMNLSDRFKPRDRNDTHKGLRQFPRIRGICLPLNRPSPLRHLRGRCLQRSHTYTTGP